MDMITLTLNVFDKDGSMTGETRTVSLPAHAVEAIVDHAAQVALLHANGDDELEVVLDELGETLDTYDLSIDSATAMTHGN